MNLEKIRIAKYIKTDCGIDIDAKDIIFDLKSKSLYTVIAGQKVGCYWDNELKTVVAYGNWHIATEFTKSLLKLLGFKNWTKVKWNN